MKRVGKRESLRENVCACVCACAREADNARAREREILSLRPSASLSSLLIIWFTNSTYHVTRFPAPRQRPVLPSPPLPRSPVYATLPTFPASSSPPLTHTPQPLLAIASAATYCRQKDTCLTHQARRMQRFVGGVGLWCETQGAHDSAREWYNEYEAGRTYLD